MKNKYFINNPVFFLGLILLIISGAFLYKLDLAGIILLLLSLPLILYRYGVVIDQKKGTISKVKKIVTLFQIEKICDTNVKFDRVVFQESTYKWYGIDRKPWQPNIFDVFLETGKTKKNLIWTSTNEFESFSIAELISETLNAPLETRKRNQEN